MSDGLTLEKMKKNMLAARQRRERLVPSGVTFCFEPPAFPGPATPSRGVPLIP